MMSFHELSRRELQSRCKEYGLPANKSNAAMATSLTSFLGDPRTNVLVRAPQAIWAKKCVKARVLQPINTETSLASFILEASEPRARVLKSLEGRKVPDLCTFVPVETVPQPKTAPLLRRKKNPGGVAPRPTTISVDSSSDLRPLHEDILLQDNGIAATKTSIAPEPQLAPVLDAAEMDACHEGPVESEPVASPSEAVLRDQGCQKKNSRCCEDTVQVALRPLVFRLTAKVDMLITKASTILRTFEEWKVNDTLPMALETHDANSELI